MEAADPPIISTNSSIILFIQRRRRPYGGRGRCKVRLGDVPHKHGQIQTQISVCLCPRAWAYSLASNFHSQMNAHRGRSYPLALYEAVYPPRPSKLAPPPPSSEPAGDAKRVLIIDSERCVGLRLDGNGGAFHLRRWTSVATRRHRDRQCLSIKVSPGAPSPSSGTVHVLFAFRSLPRN